MKQLRGILGAAVLASSIGNAVELNDVLPEPYPNVYNIEVLPFDPHAWSDFTPLFRKYLNPRRTKVVIEVGSWLGSSTRVLAKMIPAEGVVFAIDTWKGSVEHQPGQNAYYPALPFLYQQFLSNVIHANLQHKIIPVRMSSTEAAQRLKPLDIKADFIFIDASHEYEDVCQDLEAWYPFLRSQRSIFCGDDYIWPGVKRAVDEFAEKHRLKVICDGLWILRA